MGWELFPDLFWIEKVSICRRGKAALALAARGAEQIQDDSGGWHARHADSARSKYIFRC